MLWFALLRGWDPPTQISEEHFMTMKGSVPSALRGFIGFSCSFGAKWPFGKNGAGGLTSGFSRHHDRNSHQGDDATHARALLLKKASQMAGVKIEKSDYAALHPQGSLIYCDPPYEGADAYPGVPKMDFVKFWETMRRWSGRMLRNTVVISSYKAPADFKCISAFPVRTSIALHPRSTARVDCLFMKR